MGRVITIDGPAASGKSSVSRELAHHLGGFWLSTGAFYRGLALACLKLNCDRKDQEALVKLAQSKQWRVHLDQNGTKVFFNEKDVTPEIHQEEIGSIASEISHFPDVRNALLAAQRSFAESTKLLIAEGRDCGTVVFPDAQVKVYLTATGESRAHRRAFEQGRDAGDILKAQSVRDAQDIGRKTAPLAIPTNAFVLDTSEMDFQTVVGIILDHIRKTLN